MQQPNRMYLFNIIKIAVHFLSVKIMLIQGFLKIFIVPLLYIVSRLFQFLIVLTMNMRPPSEALL